MFGFATVVALLAAPAVLAHPLEHSHVESRSLGARWFHESNHPVTRLFARQSNASVTPGSPDWAKQYPTTSKLTAKDLKPEWKAVLDNAVSSGLIPTNCPVAKQSGGAAPSYSNSTGKMDPAKQPICSSSSQCRGDDQVYDMPDGLVGISFDDGPLPPSPTLYDFLKQNNVQATHFYIGQNVVQYYKFAQQAFAQGDDLAVHTWSHPYMTTLSNEVVMAELAWTMQSISDISGGRVPRFWRPPYGDSDNRVRAIAKLLGLTTVIWNDDTNDWAITENPPTQSVSGATSVLKKAYAGPKSPGLCILEHELSTQSVNIFITNFPLIAQNGWTAKSIAGALDAPFYQNSADNTSPVTTVSVGQPVPTLTASTSTTSSNSTSGGNSSGGTNSGANSGSSSPSSETSHSAALPNAAWPAWLSLAVMIPMSVALF
ncbi:unnamed protein product [Rhizoctonia solani]|uniref:chitin deacetylase n=1 Tax=Rhizoctonia solani TaxID=456999 RepID=A0A8H3HKS3_9AGAM|nr:unnamed protein product [Rhizoctonia solani]CAE6524654.1 unnamed protein product [Rhizoctonia solani]